MRRSVRSVAIAGFVGVVALPAAASAAPPPWHAQNSGVVATLKGIEFSDSCHGWAVGEATGAGVKAPIMATRNGGKTWLKQNSHMPDTTLNRADFVDSTHGWAVGEPREITSGTSTTFTGQGTILRTTNGGTTWTDQTNNVTPALDPTAENDNEGLSFISRTEGWIAVSSFGGTGSGGAILHTSDGGTTYTQQVLPNTANVADVYFVDASNGWAVNDNAEILNTTDGGTTWTVQYATGGLGLEAVAFYNALRGVAVGDSGKAWVTTDGGASWNPAVVAAPSGSYDFTTFTDVSFPTANRVAVSAEPNGNFDGSPTHVLVSSNGGAVLYPQSTATSLTLNSVAFPRGSASGWASGENGTIQSNNPKAGAGC